MLLRLLVRRAPQRDRRGRRRPGDLPLPRRVAEEPARLPARVPRRRRWSGSSATTARAGASSPRPRAVVAPCRDRIDKELRGASGGARALLALPLGARAGAGGGRRGRAADRRTACRPDEICVLVRSVKDEGAVVAAALEERAIPSRHVGLGRLLPARRGARRARLAARARRPGRLRRGGARAVAAAGRAALGGRRAADPARAPAQARHAVARWRPRSRGRSSREEGRDRARAFLRLYRSASQRVRGPPARRVRACA